MAFPAHPHVAPPWVCDPVCVVEAALPDLADDAALFDWVTSPSEPGLETRTGDASFDAPSWTAADSAAEPCSVSAACARAGVVRLRHVTVRARAEHPDGDVGVRRVDLLGRREGDRELIGARGLLGRLDAAPARCLAGGLRRRGGVAGRGRRTRRV